MKRIAYELGYLQGWLGYSYNFDMPAKTNELEGRWIVGFNLGRIRYLEERTHKDTINILIAE